MTGDSRPGGAEPELIHCGTVASGLSHELSNALATTQAAAGLIEDYAGLIRRGREVDPDRFRVAAERVGRSLQRGLKLVEHLNWFAHSMDDPARSVTLRSLAERVAESAAVLTRRRGATLEIAIPPEPVVMLTGSEFELHHILYLAVQLALQHTANRATVVLRGEQADADRVWVNIAVSDRGADDPDPIEGLAALRDRLRRIGGTIEIVEAPAPALAFVLSLPRSLLSSSGGEPPSHEAEVGETGIGREQP